MSKTRASLRHPGLGGSLLPVLFAFPLLWCPKADARDSSKPRVIVIEPSSSGAATPTDDESPNTTGKSVSDEEQRAQDNALLAGAVELEPTLHVGDDARRVEREIPVRSGHCYSVSVAWKAAYRATISYTFGRAADGRAISDTSSGDSGVTYPREGVVQFCADRSGPVRVAIVAEDNGAGAEADHEYVMVVGSRQETAAQRDARHRRASALKHPDTTEQAKKTVSRKAR